MRRTPVNYSEFFLQLIKGRFMVLNSKMHTGCHLFIAAFALAGPYMKFAIEMLPLLAFRLR
jgi:hypothetical protein